MIIGTKEEKKMCNSCFCEKMDKCSVRGNAPVGWCCEKCSTFNPLGLPCANKFEVTKTREYIALNELIISEEQV